MVRNNVTSLLYQTMAALSRKPNVYQAMRNNKTAKNMTTHTTLNCKTIRWVFFWGGGWDGEDSTSETRRKASLSETNDGTVRRVECGKYSLSKKVSVKFFYQKSLWVSIKLIYGSCYQKKNKFALAETSHKLRHKLGTKVGLV